MNSKKVNLAFLISVIFYVGGVFALSAFCPSVFENIILNNLICESMMVLPGLVIFLISEKERAEFLSFHRVKVSTLLAVILFTFFSMPLISLANLVSQFFTTNRVIEAMETTDMGQTAFLPLFLSVGIFAPFCEELLCRGIYYRGYRRSGSAFRAMLLSALLFALLHMNINQAIYAFLMGVLAVLLVEATGSLWTSVFYHMLINSSQVILMSAMTKIDPGIYSDSAAQLTNETLAMSTGSFLIIAAVMTPFAWMILVWMSKNENRRGVLMEILEKRKEKKERMVSVPLVLAVLFCAAVIIYTELAG